jgi:hypothetical protein
MWSQHVPPQPSTVGLSKRAAVLVVDRTAHPIAFDVELYSSPGTEPITLTAMSRSVWVEFAQSGEMFAHDVCEFLSLGDALGVERDDSVVVEVEAAQQCFVVTNGQR